MKHTAHSTPSILLVRAPGSLLETGNLLIYYAQKLLKSDGIDSTLVRCDDRACR